MELTLHVTSLGTSDVMAFQVRVELLLDAER